MHHVDRVLPLLLLTLALSKDVGFTKNSFLFFTEKPLKPLLFQSKIKNRCGLREFQVSDPTGSILKRDEKNNGNDIKYELTQYQIGRHKPSNQLLKQPTKSNQTVLQIHTLKMIKIHHQKLLLDATGLNEIK